MYSLNLIKILTVENQLNRSIYNQLYNLFELLKEKQWIKKFIFWELQIIKLVGYDINFNDYVDGAEIIHNAEYIPTIDGSKQIPKFLINKQNLEANKNQLKDGLKIVVDFLNKSVFNSK